MVARACRLLEQAAGPLISKFVDYIIVMGAHSNWIFAPHFGQA
jgi:hypothetical protein